MEKNEDFEHLELDLQIAVDRTKSKSCATELMAICKNVKGSKRVARKLVAAMRRQDNLFDEWYTSLIGGGITDLEETIASCKSYQKNTNNKMELRIRVEDAAMQDAWEEFVMDQEYSKGYEDITQAQGVLLSSLNDVALKRRVTEVHAELVIDRENRGELRKNLLYKALNNHHNVFVNKLLLRFWSGSNREASEE